MTFPPYFKDYAPQLFSNGYNVIPLTPGEKRPSIDGWSTLDITRDMVDKWAHNGKGAGGVGSECKLTPVVDIDIKDKKTVIEIVKWCDRHLGRTVRRIGEAPKAALFFRTDEPFTKLMSKKYQSPDGKEHRIEILGDGQQCVVFATHPGTKKPYKFAGGESLLDVPHKDLPLLTKALAEDLIQHFENVVPNDWEVVDEGASTSAPVDDPFEQALEAAKGPLDITTERVRGALETISPDVDYHKWCNVIGKALFHQFEGDAEGLEIWDEWSAGGASYIEGMCERKWGTFDTHAKPGVKTVTFASVLAMAKEKRAKEDNLDGWLRSHVYVAQGDLVCDLDKPPHNSLLRMNEFKNLKCNKTHEIPAPTKAAPDKMRKIPLSMAWLQHPERKHAQGTQYTPGGSRIVTDSHGLNWVNEFCMPETADTYDRKKINVFEDHMKYLIPCKIERKWVTGWMAFGVQKPELRCKVTPLHISIEHGTGRGWVVELLGKLLGQWNCTKTKMATLSGEGNAGAYNDYLDRSLLCCVEEVRESGKRFGISDKTRDVLSDLHQEVNKKYGVKETKRVYTNFFLMSNHPDALVLTKEDRRINVISGPDFIQPQRYYDKIYAWLESDGVDHLRSYLMSYDLSNFNWQRSIETPAKTFMIESNRTPTETAFMEFMEAPPAPIMTQQQIVESMAEMGAIDEFEIDEKQLCKLLQHQAKSVNRIKVGGKALRPWQLEKGRIFTNDEIRGFLVKK